MPLTTAMTFRFLHRIVHVAAAVLAASVCGESPASAQGTQRNVVVVEESGGAIAGARLVLRSTQGTELRQGATGEQGTFALTGLPAGLYWLEVAAPNFQARHVSVKVGAVEAPPVEVVLSLAPFQSEVTVTTERGMAADVERTAPVVTVREADDFRRRPLATLANALEGATGVMVQQSTYGQASPFLRGLTGYHVLNLIDGVRFNNSTFRSGPNQYLAFVEPNQAQRIEAMLGPASSQFGSDALGGAIQVVTTAHQFAGDGEPVNVKGDVNLFGASADGSAGGDASLFLAGRSVTWSAGGSWRRLNDLRAGKGRDSHHVLRRLFALSDEQIEEVVGSRQEGTGFEQSGFQTKLTARMPRQQNLTVWYQRSEQDDVRGYKDLWGGLGRLRSDFTPQELQFFYTRYEKLQVGRLDWLSGTFSVNSQGDGSIRQGLRPIDRIVQDDVRVDAFGYSGQAGIHLAGRQALVFGGEIYDEHIDAQRHETDPSTGSINQKRALYPNGSRYRTTGLFVQDVVDLRRGSDRGGAVKANIGGRFTRVDVETFADRNLNAAGQGLGVVDSSQSHHDWTFNASVTWQATTGLSFHTLVGRGFRAPNLNDLGALGLNDLGYEVPAGATIAAGSYVGASDGEGALSTGRRVSLLEAERLFNFEIGSALRWRRLYARANVFDAELKDPIVRRTLVFQQDQPPACCRDVPVTVIPPTAAQRAQGVVSVATGFDPRAVKAFVNEGSARYYGIDTLVSYPFSARWFAEANYSYLVGHDLNPTRSVRRLPPQQGALTIRYQPGGRVSWIGASAHFSGAQKNLSGGDVTDERIGAARRRTDISDFFQGGLISSFVQPGPDGRRGTPDDLFAPTNETAAQIRDRVLPIGATVNGVTIVDDGTRVPLYTETPAFASVNLEAGVPIRPNLHLNLALVNVLDRNYRVHGSGVDAPGINVYVGVRVTY